MKRVLITGADGFVASHLIAELCGAGCSEVHGIGLKEKPLAEADHRVGRAHGDDTREIHRSPFPLSSNRSIGNLPYPLEV